MWRAVVLCIYVITSFQSFAYSTFSVFPRGIDSFSNEIHRFPASPNFATTNSSFELSRNYKAPGFRGMILLKDSVTKNDLNREARKATLFSAILPGLGQAYNHKYWKIPLIYGVAGGLGYLFIGNNVEYKKYRQALINRYDDDTSTEDLYTQYDDANLISLKKKYKKRRDLCIIGVGAVYLLNIVDANVDAHLRKFDEKINENLSLSIRPCANVMMTFQQPVYYSGLKIRLKF